MQDQILNFLKKSQNYLSGEEISRSLSISRAAIWKNIQELRKKGYEIIAVPHLGYRLISSPDKLLPGEIAFQLGTKFLGRNIICHDLIPSTMDEAFRLGMEGSPEGTVVCAEGQTRGRGRRGRHWTSPKGKGIYLSIILRPSLSPQGVARLNLLTAVAVAEAVYQVSAVQPDIKWPNDLLINQKKMAGILMELSAEMDQVRFVVIGMGINVNASVNQLPSGATSLRQETGQTFSRVLIVQDVLRKMEGWYLRMRKEGFRPIVDRWRELSNISGKRIAITDPSGRFEGEAFDVDEDGGLMIRTDSGTIVHRMTGDVTVIR